MAGPNPLQDLTYALRRRDQDIDITRDGVTGRTYGGRFHIGEKHNWVAALCKTLGTLDFRFDDSWASLDVSHDDHLSFEAKVEWAVREFQAAARMPSAIQNGKAVALSTVSGAVYDGPVSGVVNAATRQALGAWLSNQLSCAVDIAGFDPEATKDDNGIEADELTGADPTPVHPNLWRDDEVHELSRVYARDLTGVYPYPLPPPPPGVGRAIENYQVLGAVLKYRGHYGPATHAGHAWNRDNEHEEVVPGQLFVPATDLATLARQLRTFRVIRASTDVEAKGYFEGGNAYDDQVVSFGLFHWTVAPTGSGELVGFLAYVRQLDPDEYRKIFGQYGLATDLVWPRLAESSDGFDLLDAGVWTYGAGKANVAYDNEEGGFETLEEGMDDQRYLRNWHAYYRFVMAARTSNRYRQAMWDMTRMRLRMLMNVAWPPSPTGDYPFRGAVTRPATYGETFRSERTLAMVLRWHVRKPGHVVDGAVAHARMQSAWATLRDHAPFSGQHDVEAWGPAHEAAWAAKLLSEFEQDVSGDYTMRSIVEWQDVPSIVASGFRLPNLMPNLADSTFDITNTGPAQQGISELMAAAPPTDNDPEPPTIQWVTLPVGNDQLRLAFGARIGATDPVRYARATAGTVRHWAVEIRNSDGVLTRRFHASRRPATAPQVHLQEVPILDQTLIQEYGSDWLDVTGLPPFRIAKDDGHAPLVAFVPEPTPATQAAVVAAFTAVTTAGTLSGTVLDTFGTAVAAALPYTDLGLGTTAPIAVVESDTIGPVRWQVTGTNPNLRYFTVRKVGNTVEVDRPGISRRYGGVDLHTTMTAAEVWQLCTDLRALGFLGAPLPPAAPTPMPFDRAVEAAVRAFQTYARRAIVATELSGTTSTIWVKKLNPVSVPEPLRYHGPINGKVDNQTRVLIDHWIAAPNRWRCPVVVDARKTTTVGPPSTAADTDFVADNVWGADEVTDTTRFFFVTDFLLPGPLPPTSQPLGVYDGGPVVRNVTGFTPAQVPISVATLTEGLWNTAAAQSTARVLAAVAAQLPCKGFIDGIDAATASRIVGLGALSLMDTTSGTSADVLGGLGVLLSVARAVEPAAYGAGFGRDGIVSSRPWDSSKLTGIFNDDPSGRLLAGVVCGTPKANVDRFVNQSDAPEWRGWHSVYRLASAARAGGMARAYYDVARLQLLLLGGLRVAMPAGFTPTTRPLNEVFTSERDWAVLNLWHARFPGEVVVKPAGTRTASPTLTPVIAKLPPTTVFPLPATDQTDQDTLNGELVKLIQTAHPLATDPDFFNAIGAFKTSTALSAVPGSFQIDGDHLPVLPTGVVEGLLSVLARLGPAPAAGTPNHTSVGLSGVYDSVAQVFKATGVVLATAFTSGIQAVSMALDEPRAFGMELDEGSAAPVTVAGAPGDEPQAAPMMRIKPGSDLTGLTAAPFAFDMSHALGNTAFPVAGRLDLANLKFDGAGELQGTIRSLFDLNLPFGGGPTTLALAGAGDDGSPLPAGLTPLSAVSLDETKSQITATAAGLGDVLASLPGWPFALPAKTDFALKAVPAGSRFAFALATPAALSGLDLDLVPTLTSLHLDGVGVVLDSKTGLGIDLPSGVDHVSARLASDLFAAAGDNAVINHASDLVKGATDTFGKLFQLGTAAGGAAVGDGARLVAFDGRTPRIAGALLTALTNFQVNDARRLRTFAGELPAGLPARMHTRLAQAAGSVAAGYDAARGVWFLEIPLGLKFNDENSFDKTPAVDTRDLFKVEGRFRFEIGGDPDFARFNPGSFALVPEVEMVVNDPDAARGRSFAGLVSLHVPDGTVFVFSTDPTRAGLRWDKDKSQAANVGKILIRIPASDGLNANPDLTKPESKRFTFELDSFALTGAGLDLGGAVRVEKVGLNDDDSNLDQQATTGMQAPLSVQKADPKPPGAADDDPVVGMVHFKNSHLVNGSLRAGFQLRFFDDATGTIGFLVAEDPATKRLSITGTVEINAPTEYRFDPIYCTFQLRSLRLTTTYTRDPGTVTWSSEGTMAGAVKFQPPAGQSANGPLAALSDFFSGLTCEFEDLNPVHLGRGAAVTFNFPPKTFNLANVMEVDLNGITVGNSKETGGRHRFSLLGDVRLKDLPGVDGSLTFGGIDLTASASAAPELDIKRIGAALTIPGGVEIDATFERIKNAQENGFAGAMTVRSDALPAVSGLIKLTEVKCRNVDRTVPSMALYLGADIDASLAFGFFLRNLGLGVGIFQALRGLDSANKALPMPQRVIKFVDDPLGIPSPATIDSWVPDPPDKPRGRLNWMLVAQALITYGKLPPDKPHVLAGTLLVALDEELTLTAGTNIWLFASPEEIVRPDFLANPAARGAMQISPREGKVFGYFRTLPNPKMGSQAPPVLGEVLSRVQTSYMFLADRNGFLTEVGWPWETRADLELPSPYRGELTSGYRFGLYRGVVVFGLNYGIDVKVDAEAGIDFNTPLGSAGAHLSVHGSGYFRASFVGALDQAFRPYLLGDVRLVATVSVHAEAHVELSRKITRWLKIRLRINLSASFNLSITAALAAAMDSTGALGFSGDAHVSVCVGGYRISGQVPFQFNPDLVGAVRDRLNEILPPSVTTAGAGAAHFAAPHAAHLALAPAAALALVAPTSNWQTRSRHVPGTRRVLVSLLPAPGVAYPPVADPDKPDAGRFSIGLKVADTAFVGFLGDRNGAVTPASGTLSWSENFDPSHPLLQSEDLQPSDPDNVKVIDDGAKPDGPAPAPLTLGLFLSGLSGDGAIPGGFQGSEVVDPRTTHPAPDDVDDRTMGVPAGGVLSPNFGRDRSYDQRVSDSCARSGVDSNAPASPPDVDGASFSLIAAESLDLFGRDAAARDAAARDGTVPDRMFVAHRLRGILMFDLPTGTAPSGESYDTWLAAADQGDDISNKLIDPTTFLVATKKTDLVSALAGSDGRSYDLTPGHVFQSDDQVALCWELRFQDQADDDHFEAYLHGFDHFQVTRTNLTNPRSRDRVDTIHACWLDPSQGGRVPAAGDPQHIRPPFQYVDRELGATGSDSRDVVVPGDVLLYRVEAIGLAGHLLASCLFEVVRQIVKPLEPPAAALALHRPLAKDAVTLVDSGSVELTLLWPTRSDTNKPVPIPHNALRVMFRLVGAGTVGSYGFDASPSATTRPDPGLPAPAQSGLGAPPVHFSASPQSRPMPWEETRELDHTKLVWTVLTAASGDEIGARVVLDVDDLWSRVRDALGTEPDHGRALELWVGQETGGTSVARSTPGGSDSRDRSILTPFRHAVVLPETEPSSTTIDAHYVTRGSTVAAIEPLPPRDKDRKPSSRFLAPGSIVAEVVGSPVPAESNPNQTVINDVRLALAWRMPPEANDAPYEPVVGFRIDRVDRFNPALYRASQDGIAPCPETLVKVVPERLYRATPDAIELLPVTFKDDVTGLPTVGADWRPAGTPPGGSLWTVTTTPAAAKPFPYQDPDGRGAICLHDDLIKVAAKLTTAIKKATGEDARVVWRVREPLEDRADLQADDDRDPVVPSKVTPARDARFSAALGAFRAAHPATSDPYGWSTTEALGLSAEIVLVQADDNEPFDLFDLIRNTQLLQNLQDSTETAPVAVLLSLADDGETYLDAVRLLHTGTLPDWNATSPGQTVFDPKVVLGLKLIGIDPQRRWPYGDDYKAGPDAMSWLRGEVADRLKLGLGEGPLTAAGQVIVYRRGPATDPAAGSRPRTLPVDRDGTVRLDLKVPDRLAHVYDIAIEPLRRYDALWDALAPETAGPPEIVPYAALRPVKVDRTRPLVPHDVVATPLPGAAQAFVFTHPAEFAACASALQAAAVEYAGHWSFLQRRIPDHDRIASILTDPTVLAVDWGKNGYVSWLKTRNYEAVDFPGDGRTLVLTPPIDPDPFAKPPVAGDPPSMLRLAATRVGIFGADRYVVPDLPAYYEYRFAAISAAGRARSAPAFTPFVRPLFDAVRQRPSSDGLLLVDDSKLPDLTLEVVLVHSRLHLRSEMRGLWVDSDDTFPFKLSDGTTVNHKFGSLPDLALTYKVLINANYDPDNLGAFQVLNTHVSLIPPLDPQRQPDTGSGPERFMARSSDKDTVGVVAGGTPGLEAEVAYNQNAKDGSIRLVVPLRLGTTPGASTIREILGRAPSGRKHEPFAFFVSRGGVQSAVVAGASLGT